MTKAYFTKKARTDLYCIGKQVERVHEHGKNKGQKYTARDRTQPANKADKLFVKKGESYWWWQFAFRPKQYSKTKPTRSQLTQSEFFSWLYDLEDHTIGEATASTVEDLKALVEEWKTEIESQRDELQDKLDNMPEQLQSVGSGETLQERIDGLDSWVSDLEAVDLDVDEDTLRNEARSEVEDEEETRKTEYEKGLPKDEKEREKWEPFDALEGDEFEAAVDEKFRDKLQDAVNEILYELQNCSSGL